jgi:tetratricopeptide (TPR) repeat protein
MTGEHTPATLFARAVDIKRAMLADARREYEEAPSFVRCTVIHDEFDARYQAVRALSTHERAEFSRKYIAQANEAVVDELYDDAMEHYTDALAVFCYFARGEGASTSTLAYTDYLEDDDGDDEGREIVKTIMLNASACLMNKDLKTHAKDVVWACGHALRVDERSAKAYYRRGKALAALEEHEQAMKDLKRAVELAPDDAQYARTLAQCTRVHVHREQQARRVFGKMFNAGAPLYDDANNDEKTSPLTSERSMSGTLPYESEVSNEVERVLRDEDLMEKARAMGFDVDEDAFREELAARVREQILRDKLERAKDLGIDLNDERVKQAMDFFDRQKAKANVHGRRDALNSLASTWTSYVSPALLTLIFCRVAYVIITLITSPLPP